MGLRGDLLVWLGFEELRLAWPCGLGGRDLRFKDCSRIFGLGLGVELVVRLGFKDVLLVLACKVQDSDFGCARTTKSSAT